MSILHIYPTSRAIREFLASSAGSSEMPPALMRMDEFEKRVAVVPGRAMVDPLQRIVLLRKAAGFEEFESLKIEKEILRFYSGSGDIFKFFEELAWELVDMDILKNSDVYAEYAEHIDILERLRENYRAILSQRALSDKMFIPSEYRLNEKFLGAFSRIVVHIEGYPSRFELRLLKEASSYIEVWIEMRTSRFNEKVVERFGEMGIDLPPESELLFDMASGEIITARKIPMKIEAEVLAVGERFEQIATALAKIEEMIDDGMAPEKIALILPDESLSKAMRIYDRAGNLNFAMGFDYCQKAACKILRNLDIYWRRRDECAEDMLRSCGVEPLSEELSPTSVMGVDSFLEWLSDPHKAWNLLEKSIETDTDGSDTDEAAFRFARVFATERFSLREWLFLWLRQIDNIRQDDVGGGRVTVMGVLETRALEFEGVVIVDFNEGRVPAPVGKERFLDSRVRKMAGLPLRSDREAMQKQYYARVLEKSRKNVIIYVASDSTLPSRFVYELGLNEGRAVTVDADAFYPGRSDTSVTVPDPVVRGFDASRLQWSPTMLKIWLSCKRRFYYRYIEKLQEKREEEINEGRFLHEALRVLFSENGAFDDEKEMSEKLEAVISGMLGEKSARARYLEKLWSEHLRAFVAVQVKHFREGWIVEQCEMPIKGEIGGLGFAGKVDRIDRRGDETMILDYKSGSIAAANRTRNLEKLEDFQMSIYQTIVSHIYPDPQPFFVKLFENGTFEPYSAPEEKNAILMEHIRELVETESFEALRCEELNKCRYCPYALLCERGEYL